MIRKITLLVGALYALWSLLWRVNVVGSPGEVSTVRGQVKADGPFVFFSGLTRVFARDDSQGQLRDRLRGIVRKHLVLQFQNRAPRAGIRQLLWVRRETVETVQGHVGSCTHMAPDFGRVLNWPSSKIQKLVEMLLYHELDEYEEGDESLWSMAQKKSPDWEPVSGEAWLESRRQKYFVGKEGKGPGRAVVMRVLEACFTDEEERQAILVLSDEFVEARTDVALLANQIDNFQGVLEAGARFRFMALQSCRGAGSARWNFLNYCAQSEAIMEFPVMIIALEVLKEEVLGIGLS